MPMPAILGTAPLGGFRLGYIPSAFVAHRKTKARITIGGVDVTTRVRLEALSVHDALNAAPNTAALTVQGAAPTVGQPVRITVNSDTPVLLLSGALETVALSYEGRPAQWVYPCTATDDLPALNRRLPFGAWTNVSATTIALEILARFAPGFTGRHVAPDLPRVSIILDGSEGFTGALTQLASLIGGYFYVEERDLHLFQTELTDAPDPIDSSHPFLDDPPISVTYDLSQVRTRVYGKGHGDHTIGAVAIGESIVPIANAVMFNPPGGQAISDTQILRYTGVQPGGGSTLVGPGVTPTTGPYGSTIPGSGITNGLHKYANTWVTAAGETLPGPLWAIQIGGPGLDPALAPSFYRVLSYATGPVGGGLGAGVYQWAYTLRFGTGETRISPIFSLTVANPGSRVDLAVPFEYAPGMTEWSLYRTVANGSQLKLAWTTDQLQFNYWWTDDVADGALGANAPTVNTTAGSTSSAQIYQVSAGPAAVTSRRVYRTAAGGAQLKLLTTLTGSATTYIDSTPDAGLGANAPTTDTSGLATGSTGRVLAGSPTLITAAASVAFDPAGGWIINGGQLIRYTGVTGNTLTGIPVSGLGSIVATINYNERVTQAPALTGVTGILVALVNGAPVNLWVQVDDVAAQVDLAALEGGDSDGIHEHRLSDERRGEASLTALCLADLTLFSRPIVTVRYATRDLKTKSGKPIVVDLPSPPIAATLTIQDVTITEIDLVPGLAPRFTVTASSVRFSLDDLLRRLTAAAAAGPLT